MVGFYFLNVSFVYKVDLMGVLLIIASLVAMIEEILV
jgi:hypothetical protein